MVRLLLSGCYDLSVWLWDRYAIVSIIILNYKRYVSRYTASEVDHAIPAQWRDPRALAGLIHEGFDAIETLIINRTDKTITIHRMQVDGRVYSRCYTGHLYPYRRDYRVV